MIIIIILHIDVLPTPYQNLYSCLTMPKCYSPNIKQVGGTKY